MNGGDSQVLQSVPTRLPEGPVNGQWPTVSIIVPMYNEERYVQQFVQCMISQDYPPDRLEVLLVDGGSSDGTLEIARQVAQQHGHFRLLHNPGRTQPCGVNTGVMEARGQYVSRADVHVGYPPDYIRACITAMQSYDVGCVGGVINTQPGDDSHVARAIAIVQSHPFGVGNSYDRISTKARIVDAVAFPTCRRELFERIGLYHELLPRHEDVEFYSRIRRAGGKLMVLPSIRTTYYSRPTIGGLLKQAWQNGYETALAWLVNHDCANARHWIPGLFVASLIVLGAAAPSWAFARWLLVLNAGAYLAALLISALHVGLTRGWRFVPVTAATFVLHHLAYGLATIAGTIELVRSYRKVKRYCVPVLDDKTSPKAWS